MKAESAGFFASRVAVHTGFAAVECRLDIDPPKEQGGVIGDGYR
jgi:hypothetical protein